MEASNAAPTQEQLKALIALYQQGRLEETLVQGAELARQFPTTPTIPYLLGSANTALKRMKQAVACYRSALEINPDYAEAFFGLGGALKTLGNTEAAITSYQRAVAKKPEFAQAHNNLGNMLKETGELDQAAESFKKALNAKADYGSAHFNLGTVLAELGELEDAVKSFTNAIAYQPDFVAAHYNLGKTLVSLGAMEEAVSSYRSALDITPENSVIHHKLGNALRALGKMEEAVASYNKALDIDPLSASTHNSLGAVLLQLEMPEIALGSFQKAVEIDSSLAEAHGNLGNTLKALGRLEETVPAYQMAIKLNPVYADFHSNLGVAFADLERLDDSLNSHSNAVLIDPDSAALHYNQGNALKALGRHEEAVLAYETALQLMPEFTQAYNSLGGSLNDLERPLEAIVKYKEALQLNPEYAEAYSNLGAAQNHLGDRDSAIASYKQALRINPELAVAHRNLSLVSRYTDDDLHIHQMRELLDRTGLSDADRMQLSFALGVAYDKIGHYKQAFCCLEVGNALRKKELGFDVKQNRVLFEKICESFTNELPVLNGPSDPREATGSQPVFIVGMPRSGTTLVEQILASHSQVYGAGELKFLGEAVRRTEPSTNAPTVEQLQLVRDSYLAEISSLGAVERCVTDKLPLNFRWIGFILTALPEAKIIHIKRDAGATCWSNYKHFFSEKGNRFAYNQVDVAEYYNMYIDLMSFWNDRAPGRIHNVQYETLTEQQETESRKMINYLELDWEEACLDFHNTNRPIHTASVNQVKQQMYTGSSEQWRNYEAFLGPMLEVLDRDPNAA